MAVRRYNEPFFWHRIVNVGWASGGVVVLEVEFLQGVTAIAVNVLSPSDIFTSSNPGFTEILKSDYQNDENWYAKAVGDFETIQTGIILQDEITDIWVWDAFLINPLGDDTGVAEGNATFGPFDLHFAGMQVAHDTAVFNRPELGDWVEHTHPNGTSVIYRQGATPLAEAFISWQQPGTGTIFNGVVIRPDDPNGVPPVEDLSGTESWYWYHTTTSEGSDTDKIRRSWLVYFATNRTIRAELRLAAAIPSTLPDGIVNYNIRGYPDGTEFDIADGHITPKPPGVAASWETTGTFPVGAEGVVVFNASGIGG